MIKRILVSLLLLPTLACAQVNGKFNNVTATSGTIGPVSITNQGRVTGVTPTANVTALPRLMRKLRNYRQDLQTPINIVDFGSSVDCGATLPNPSVDAPGAYFTTALQTALDPAHTYNFQHYSYCQNGSVVTNFTQAPAAGYASTAWATMQAASVTPDVCVFVYQMNDAGVAAFNTGQTRPGFASAYQQAITTCKQVGADVVAMTSPHPAVAISIAAGGGQWSMPPGINQYYPTFVAAPVSQSQIQPPYPGTGNNTSVATADFVGNGLASIEVDRRMLILNADVRSLAADNQIPVVDAEKYAFQCIQAHTIARGTQLAAEADLFDPGQIVHPNLAYHQCSYHAAIDDFSAAVGRQVAQGGEPDNHAGYTQLNGDSTNTPALAVQDIYPPYPDMLTPPWRVSARTGSADGAGVKGTVEAWRIDPATGDLLSSVERIPSATTAVGLWSATTHSYYAGNSASGVVQHFSATNITAGSTALTISLPNNSGGRLRIRAIQPGVAQPQIWDNIFTTHNGATYLSSAREIGSGTMFSLGVSGTTLTITNTYDNTGYYTELETW